MPGRETLITGKKGIIKQGQQDTAFAGLTNYNVKNWKLEITGGAIDITDSSQASLGARAKVPKKYYEWSGDCEVLVKGGDVELEVNKIYSIAFVAESTPTDEVYWMGNAIVTSVGISTPIEGEDVVIRTIKFEGAGAITKTDNYLPNE